MSQVPAYAREAMYGVTYIFYHLLFKEGALSDGDIDLGLLYEIL